MRFESPQEISPTLSTSDVFSSSSELYAQLRIEIDALRAESEKNKTEYEKTIAVAQLRLKNLEKANIALRNAQLERGNEEPARVAELRKSHGVEIAEMRKDNLKLYANQQSVQTSYNQLKVRYDAVCIENQMLIPQLQEDNNILAAELEAALEANKMLEGQSAVSERKNQNLLRSIDIFQEKIALLEQFKNSATGINLQKQLEEIWELRSKVARLEKKEMALGLKANRFEGFYNSLAEMHRSEYLGETLEKKFEELCADLNNVKHRFADASNKILKLEQLLTEKNNELVRLKKENTGLIGKIATLEEKLNLAVIGFSNLLDPEGEISRAKVNSLLFLPAKQEVATQTSAPALEL